MMTATTAEAVINLVRFDAAANAPMTPCNLLPKIEASIVNEKAFIFGFAFNL